MPTSPSSFPVADISKLDELGQSDEATKVWAEAGKHNKTAYIPWIEYASALEYAVRPFLSSVG
jgi:hypothetical protein